MPTPQLLICMSVAMQVSADEPTTKNQFDAEFDVPSLPETNEQESPTHEACQLTCWSTCIVTITS